MDIEEIIQIFKQDLIQTNDEILKLQKNIKESRPFETFNTLINKRQMMKLLIKKATIEKLIGKGRNVEVGILAYYNSFKRILDEYFDDKELRKRYSKDDYFISELTLIECEALADIKEEEGKIRKIGRLR